MPDQELRYSVCIKCHDAVHYDDIDDATGICRHCVSRAAAIRESRDARNSARAVLREIILQNRPNKIDAPHISEMFAEVVQSLGGLESTMRLFVEDYLDCRERSPGSSTVLRFWECMARMAKDSSALRASAPDAANMTDDQLASEMLVLVEQATKRRRLEFTQSTLVEAMIDVECGDADQGPAPATGAGEPQPPDGGAAVLSADPEPTEVP